MSGFVVAAMIYLVFQPFRTYLIVQANTNPKANYFHSLFIISCTNLTRSETKLPYLTKQLIAGKKQQTRNSNTENEGLFHANTIN